MGRVIESRIGHDLKVRAVVMKTNTGYHTRPIVKVVPLYVSNHIPIIINFLAICLLIVVVVSIKI